MGSVRDVREDSGGVKDVNVLFLTRYPIEGASSRYRVYQYVPHLEKLGVTCRVQSFMDKTMYERSFAAGGAGLKLWHMLKASLSRIRVLMRYKDFDVIYMQREMFPFGPPLAERFLKSRGAILVFDYDDALFIERPSRYNAWAASFRSAEKTFDIFWLSDCVIAGNDWLRDVARQYCTRAETIEVAEDTNRIKLRAPHTNQGGVLVGWLGSPSTVKYLRQVEAVLRRISNAYPFVRFEIMGGGDFNMGDLPVTHTDWSLNGELEALGRFDIGIMPLPNEDWARGKSGGKARTYMAAGVPPVCTKIGYNIELVRDGETGFLCMSDAEWEMALGKLIENPDLRQTIAVAARADVQERFSPERQAAKIHGVLRSLLDERHGAVGFAARPGQGVR